MFILLCLFAYMGVQAQDVPVVLVAAEENAVAKFDWASTVHDFGEVTKGIPVTHEFSFVNTGSKPLLVTEVKASCGCTVSQYSKNAIAPGETGFVKATYNAAVPGSFNKSLTIFSNTEGGLVKLSMKGIVIE